MAKGILRLIVRRTNGLLKPNGVDDARRRSDVQDLHDRVVQAVVRGEEVGVSSEEDEEEELVGAEGDALGVAGDAQAEEEDDDGEDVGHVPAQAEDVHAHGGVVGWLVSLGGFLGEVGVAGGLRWMSAVEAEREAAMHLRGADGEWAGKMRSRG